MNVLRWDGVDIAYRGDPAVRGAAIDIAPGEIVGLVGRSGSGKSTLALATLGLLPPEARVGGRIVLDGTDVVGASPAILRRLRGGIAGMIFQEPMSALNSVMTIGSQIAETLRLHLRLTGGALHAQVAALLDDVGLAVPAGRYPHELSGGQRQRAAIAVAIAAGPKLLIADEPTSALDGQARDHIAALLQRLVAERGMALLLVSHDLPLVNRLADRIAIIDCGRIVAVDRPAALVNSDVPAVRALYAATPPVIGRSEIGPAVLEARGLTRIFRRRGRDAIMGLDDVSLDIGAGEAVGLVGASGSGKSTLVRALLGLERLDAGEVRLLGERFTGQRRLRAAMQAVFQDPASSFDPRWSVGRIIAEPLHLTGEPADVGAMLEAVGLSAAIATRRPAELSGGQRQRVALARALILRPRLVLLDEALSALDPITRAEILALIADLSARFGTSWLFVGHDLATVRAASKRVLSMTAGRLTSALP